MIRSGSGGGDSTPSPGDTIDGVFTGRAGVEKRYTALFKLYHFEDHLNTLDHVHTPFETVPWAVGGYEVTAAGALGEHRNDRPGEGACEGAESQGA